LDILEIIKSRRSVRTFTDKPLGDSLIEKILEAGRWAPSGMNNQPWRFGIVEDRTIIDKIAPLTRYSHIVRNARVLITVFLDAEESYHREKDIQAIGACLQNMLLEAHSLGLGAVWLGEIIKSDKQIREILGLGSNLELMAVVALGHPDEKPRRSTRKKLEDIIIFKK
jgi:nitroreductase